MSARGPKIYFNGTQLWSNKWLLWELALFFFVWPGKLVLFEFGKIISAKMHCLLLLWRSQRMLRKNQISVGRYAEIVARSYLVARGLQFVVSNWRAGIGEIDLVMETHAELVVVEVKSRLSASDSLLDGSLSLFDNIDRRKSEKLRHLASLYYSRTQKRAQKNRKGERSHLGLRIDLIGVNLKRRSGKIIPVEIFHFISAL